MKTRDPNRIRGGGMRKALMALPVVLLAFLLATVPASAEVRAGKSVTVFHAIDMVGATGYPVGQDMTVEVWRDGINIGSATGPAVNTPEGAGLEVNHGTEAAVPGDCWDGITPDILPGDEVRVVGDNGTDSVIVADVNFDDGFPLEVTAANADRFPGAQAGDVILEGTAFNEDGTPMDTAQLAGEFRIQPNPRYRAEPNLVQDLDGAAGGAWRAVYRTPYADVDDRDGLTDAQKKDALLDPGAEHAMVFAPNVRETHITDNAADGGPAPGCEGSPRSANAVTTFDDRAVNVGSGDLVANGTALDGTQSVEVTLEDEDPATPDVTKTANLSGTAWTVTFGRAEVEPLSDGQLTATGGYTGPNVPSTGATKSIQKDVVAPVITAGPEAGTFDGPQRVALSSDGNERIRFSTDGNAPNDNSRVYDGSRILVDRALTIRAFATDEAGNRTDASFDYVVRTRSTVSLQLRSAKLKLGRAEVIRGKVAPGHPGETVKLTVKRGGKTVVSRSVKLNDSSAYSARYKPNRPGRYVVKVRFTGDADHLAGAKTKAFRVTRR